MAAFPHYPEIRALEAHECESLLGRNHVGRMAFTFRDRVDIQPLHYVYEDRWIYIRTSEGQKLKTLTHHPWVAFEVDEVMGAFEWTSVVVQGTVYRVDEDAPHPDPEAEAQAIRVLRTVLPEMFTAEDPMPHRHVILRVAVKEMTGRQASPRWSSEPEAEDAATH